MTAKANNHIVLTGDWPDKKAAVDFFTAAKISIKEGQASQLFQTYSECLLEKFNANTPIDILMIEQYRAFCPAWELWIRNINAKKLQFRFIWMTLPDGKIDGLQEAGFDVENKTTAVTGLRIETASYPLWGKTLAKGEKHAAGWYTAEIPQIISYPVDEPWGKVALTVENFMRLDGTVKMVKYRGFKDGGE